MSKLAFEAVCCWIQSMYENQLLQVLQSWNTHKLLQTSSKKKSKILPKLTVLEGAAEDTF